MEPSSLFLIDILLCKRGKHWLKCSPNVHFVYVYPWHRIVHENDDKDLYI